MKRKSPLSVEEIQFYTYERYDDECVMFLDIADLPFDERSDFVIDQHLAGIAVKLEICNERFSRGVRRTVEVSVVDLTSRYEVASQCINVNLRKDIVGNVFYLDFPVKTTELRGNHTYKVIVTDTTSSSMLRESVFHLFDRNVLGHPMTWYDVVNGGIRPRWEPDTYKVLKTEDYHTYYVRFNVSPKWEQNNPAVLPELELRLYYPDGKLTTTRFIEPKCLGFENYEDGIYTVDYPFTTYREANGIYYAELLCMEYQIAGFVYATDRDAVSGSWCGKEIEPLDEYSLEEAAARLNELLPEQSDVTSIKVEDSFDQLIDDFIKSQKADSESSGSEYDEAEESETSETEGQQKSLIYSLDNLTGLSDVKKKLSVYENVVRFNNKRIDSGLPVTPTPLHAMFLGSPGTGKTTVAKIMGAMLHRAGILSKGHVVVRERATLTGQFYSSEAEKTIAALEEAKGGILFIDEAYQLYQPNDPRDPGKFVIETLLTALADDSNRDWMLILAGYPDEMMRMFDLNPGFRSRIPDSNIYTFDDFTQPELMEIAEKYLARHQFTLTHDARTALTQRLSSDYECREKNFGNARHVINLIQTEILPSMAVRVISEGSTDSASLSEIRPSDIPAPAPKPALNSHRVGFAI